MFAFKKKKNLIYIAFAVLLFLAANLTPVVRTPVFNILKIPLVLFSALGREAGGIIFYHRNMKENARLKNELDFLKQKIVALNEIYLENMRLKSLLAFKEKSSYKIVAAARVIGRSADNWSSVIIIDKGAKHGIRRGMVAMTYLGLAGRVIETASFTSKVMLINDPNLGVSAFIQRSRQEGLVSGTLGNSLIMRYLSNDADVKVSDTVITSGLTEVYPKGIPIGKVVEVGEEFSGLGRYCVIRPAVNTSNVEEVLIVIP
ncbi:MAG: rod shape-determining protein MreC [Candidatus Omnitrophota bacterium]